MYIYNKSTKMNECDGNLCLCIRTFYTFYSDSGFSHEKASFLPIKRTLKKISNMRNMTI